MAPLSIIAAILKIILGSSNVCHQSEYSWTSIWAFLFRFVDLQKTSKNFRKTLLLFLTSLSWRVKFYYHLQIIILNITKKSNLFKAIIVQTRNPKKEFYITFFQNLSSGSSSGIKSKHFIQKYKVCKKISVGWFY